MITCSVVRDEVDAATPISHPHFVCTACGLVECLPALELVLGRSKAPRSIRQRKVEVHVRGLCDACN